MPLSLNCINLCRIVSVGVASSRFSLRGLISRLGTMSAPSVYFVGTTRTMVRIGRVTFTRFRLAFSRVSSELDSFFGGRSVVAGGGAGGNNIHSVSVTPLVGGTRVGNGGLALVLSTNGRGGVGPSLIVGTFFSCTGDRPMFCSMAHAVVCGGGLRGFMWVGVCVRCFHGCVRLVGLRCVGAFI